MLKKSGARSIPSDAPPIISHQLALMRHHRRQQRSEDVEATEAYANDKRTGVALRDKNQRTMRHKRIIGAWGID